MNDRTAIFRELHQAPRILRLPNAWDAGSARLFESLGAAAIATTSAGVSWALGYADGYRMPLGVALDLAANLMRVLRTPLTVDIEDGYSDDPAKVAEVALRLADLGVAGINIEDGSKPAELLARKISAIKSALAVRGNDLFINARTDVYLAQLVAPGNLLTETLKRARRYLDAGADGLFVPGLIQADQIKQVLAEIAVPLNLMAWNGLPDAAALEKLGVRRLSAGSGIAQVVWAQAERMAKDFLETGQSGNLTGQIPYSRMQALFG